jgi:hypothetical protein
MIKYFTYEQFTGHKREVAKYYQDMSNILLGLTPGPESTVAMRKLLESRDAALRALDG